MQRWISNLVTALVLGTAFGAQAAKVGLITIDGTIGPATASYIARAIQISHERQDECLVIQLDTPGGLLDSTKEIVQSFYAAPVPTVVYVAPPPATAGSAGVFITMAADVAAMAPHTSIGAAHPVSIGGGGTVEKTDDVMKQKMENYASSFIETIADKRKRNVEWAKSAVIESTTATAEKALELNVIEIIAADIPDLLRQIDGREINGRILKTADAEVSPISMIAREKIFQVLWRPEVMFILLLMAIYGIIGELSNPGAIVPGVVGGISLILVLYMSAILPVNIAGLALIGLALALFIGDIYAPSHGILTAGGVIAFFLGALMLFNRGAPGFRLSLAFIIPGTLLTALFFIFVVGAGLRAQRAPVQSGSETMVGKIVPALSPIDGGGGKVFIEGEIWNAVSDAAIEEGQSVEIIGMQGLTLKVKPKQS